MANPRQLRNLIFGPGLSAATAALAITFLLTVVATQPAQAQTFNAIHNFTCGSDGGNPFAGLTMDKAGNLYGSAIDFRCDPTGYGTVYQLKHKGSGWTVNPLYSFTGGSDGAMPFGQSDLRPGRHSLRHNQSGRLGGMRRLGRLRHCFPSETPTESLHNRALPLDRNRALFLRGRS